MYSVKSVSGGGGVTNLKNLGSGLGGQAGCLQDWGCASGVCVECLGTAQGGGWWC